jgi:hypothetical protein
MPHEYALDRLLGVAFCPHYKPFTAFVMDDKHETTVEFCYHGSDCVHGEAICCFACLKLEDCVQHNAFCRQCEPVAKFQNGFWFRRLKRAANL